MKSPDEFAKAVVGAGVAALTALGTAVTTGDGTLDGVDASGWIAVAIAFLSTFAAVYFVPNGTARQSSPQQAGGGASVNPSQSTGAPQSNSPQTAGSGAPSTTFSPGPGGAPHSSGEMLG